MKTLKARSGPFEERPYYEDSEIESIVTDELRKTDLFPEAPKPIRVDRFIEKRFDIVPQYDDLPDGILGFTRFGLKGPEEMVISRSLSEEGSKMSERRLNSTIAHEAGHMLLHGRLFALQRRAGTRPLIKDGLDEKKQTILCRADTVGSMSEPMGTRRYDGKWWEFQANMVIGALLLPRQLVHDALDAFLVSKGPFGLRLLDNTKREEAIRCLSEAFDVNGAVARIRTEKLFPISSNRQLTL